MSEENVKVVRQSLEAANAFMRDEFSAEAFGDCFDTQIECHWRDQRTYPDAPQHLRGVQELIGFSEQFRRVWADVVQEPLEFIEAPDDRVLAPIRLSGRGRESGVPIEIHFFQVWTIREGNLREIEFFRHRADALKAAGLEE